MKKFIFIVNAIELLKQLMNGKRIEGVLYVDSNTSALTFKAYNRKSENHQKLPEALIRKTPYGRVTKTLKRIKANSAAKDKILKNANKREFRRMVVIDRGQPKPKL